MNRKWLAVFTSCVLILGLTPASQIGGRAQSTPQSPSAGAAQAEWYAADAPETFTIPLGPDVVAGFPFFESAIPFPEPFPGDAVFFFSSDSGMDFGFAGPEFSAAFPFPGPDPQGGPPAGPTTFERTVQFVGANPQDTINFVGFEAGLGNQDVVGAPYSAQVTSEFQQTLGDGNKIERKSTTTVYRDGQGRTRREQSLPAIGSYSASAQAPQAIFINDPVAGVTYVLDPTRKIARKMVRPNMQAGIRVGPPGGPQPGNPPQGNPPQGNPPRPGPGRGPGMQGDPPQGNNPQGNPPRMGPGQPQGGNPGGRIPLPPNANARDANVTTESLGNQNIEGVLVQGTRIIRTVPAGTVGNQQPIRVTMERWYSPDLKLNLLVRNSDPMRGTNITTLSNIRRDEPAASLFQVPADYAVQEPPNPRAEIFRDTQRRMTPPPPQQR